ncbi:MAG TPA: hypothetical protein VEX39_04295 [Thermoleophilaceae bacterium]|nr:hypothetical protein [Thermoleophilaceae bacterium]
MRRLLPVLSIVLASAAALIPAAQAAKPKTVKAGLYDGTISLYVGQVPPYSTKGKVALLRSQTGTNPISGSCDDGSNYRPDVDGTGPWVLKGKAPKVGKSKTYKSSAKRGDSDFSTTVKATLKVKFSSARRAKLSLSVVETITRQSGTATCRGKGSWRVKGSR